ncbi:hypothetical protein ACVGOW_32495 [Pseudonocardia saturnea]
MAAPSHPLQDLPETVVDFLERRLRLERILARPDGPVGADLQPALADVLDALRTVTEDELLWQQAMVGARSLTPEVLDELGDFVDDRLSALLVVAGYEPPPSVDVVVDDTAAALDEIRSATEGGGVSEGDVAAARAALRGFVSTAQERTAAGVSPRVVRYWGRRTARLARQVVPAVVGGAAGLLVGGLTGGASGGLLEMTAFGTVAKAVERLTELAATSLIGAGRAHGAATPGERPDPIEDARVAVSRLRRSVDAVVADAESAGRRTPSPPPRLETGGLTGRERAGLQARVRAARRDLATLELALRRSGLGSSAAPELRAALDRLVDARGPADLPPLAAAVAQAARRVRFNAVLALRIAPGP